MEDTEKFWECQRSS